MFFNSFIFEKFFPHSLRARKKYSSGSKSSSKSGTVYGFKADTVTVNHVTYFNDSDFKKFTNNWLQNASLSKSTKLRYKNIINNYLKPAFGNMLLKDIKLSHEIFALTWNDFKLLDEYNNLIQLKSREALESALSDENSKLCIEISKTVTSGELKNSTKTDRTRMLPIQSILKPYISEHLDKFYNNKIDYIFYNKSGEYYKRYPSAARKWNKILEACNIEHRQLYKNRHNFAINFLKAGATYNQTARMLGHTSSAMVINRYGNYQEDLSSMDFLTNQKDE